MPLRVKLFLYIGSLFLLVALASYFLPKIFVKGDVKRVHALFSSEIAEQNKNGREIWQRLFNERMEQSIIAINTTLSHVSTTDIIRKTLREAFQKDQKLFWDLMNNLISDNPGVSYLQVAQKVGKSNTIALNNAKFYYVKAYLVSNNAAVVQLFADEKSKEVLGPFLALRFPLNEESVKTPPFTSHAGQNLDHQELKDAAYYLYPIEILNLPKGLVIDFSAMKPVEPYVLKLQNRLLEKKINTPYDFVLLEEAESKEDKNLTIPFLEKRFEKESPVIAKAPKALEVSKGINIVREYVNVYLNEIKGSVFSKFAPIGGATLYDQNSGGALLNSDIFFDEPLYSAEEYYQRNLPKPGHTFLATGVDLIDSSYLSKYIIANSVPISETKFLEDGTVDLAVDPIFLTAGQSLFGDIRSTSIVSDSLIVFLDDTGKFIHAINNAKDEIPESNFYGFPFGTIVNSVVGQITLGSVPYSYFQLQIPAKVSIKAFILIPEAAEPMFRLQNVVNSNMIAIYEALSSQLFATSLILLGLALFLLGYLSNRITKPITLLAKATEKIPSGNYSAIHLPSTKETDDEISVLTKSFSKMIQGLQDKEKIRDLLDKVVSKEIAAEILKGNVQLGGESREATILFIDIRGFSRMTEQVDPQVVISHLNKYMTVMSNIIEEEGGVIDKYIGDEIMALYGAPVEMKNSAAGAIRTALKMLEALEEWNKGRIERGMPPIQAGVGIHTGKVVAGNMGAEKRLNYTVLGANVNLAARLCAAAAPMEIRVSEATLNASGMKDQLIVKSLPAEIYKGFSSEMITYSIRKK